MVDIRLIKYKKYANLVHRLTEVIAAAPKGEVLKRVLNPLLREYSCTVH
jgi:hypothetical protein